MKKTAALIFFSILLGLVPTIKAVSIFASSPPTLVSPNLGSSTDDTSPTLTWSWGGNCFQAGNCYRVQVDDQTDFLNPNKDSYTNNTSYSPNLTLGIWFWRLQAKDTTGTWTGWSETRNFTVIEAQNQPPAPPPTPNPATTATIRLSEFMPNPSEGSEWVELFNYGSSIYDVIDWKIDDEPGKSSPSTLDENTLISPGQYKVFQISNKLNNSGDTLRLLKPDGSEFEKVDFGSSTKDTSFARDSGGKWGETLTPTPGSANKITKGEVLADEDQTSSEENSDLKLDLLDNLTASSSTVSQRPIENPVKPLAKEARNFLPVIFVGLGVFLLLASILFFLLKIGWLKKYKKRTGAPAGNPTSAPK